jgi:hypothetical protein
MQNQYQILIMITIVVAGFPLKTCGNDKVERTLFFPNSPSGVPDYRLFLVFRE